VSSELVQDTKKTWHRLLLVILVTLGCSVAIFTALDPPFLWALALWAVAAFAGVAITRRTAPRAILVNIAVVFLVIAVFEGYLWSRELRSDPTRMRGSYTTDYFGDDELLGYGPEKEIVATAEKYYDEQLIYRVRYTINADGLRVSPPASEDEDGCVLFFGGSFTFGEGLEDDQSLPFQVGVLTDGHNRIYNFGFHGYGPHHMLAALETGRVDQIIGCQPSHVIYQAILHHVERVAGLTTWDEHGPRYVIAPSGGVTLAGHFDDEYKTHPWKGWFSRSLTYDTLFGKRRSSGPDEAALFAEIVATARTFVESRYNGAQFHVLLWDKRYHSNHKQALAALQSRDLRIHCMTTILPDYKTDKARYMLHRFDHHPTAATNGLIGRYVAEQILGHGDGNMGANRLAAGPRCISITANENLALRGQPSQ